MPHRITVLPQNRCLECAAGENLLAALRASGFLPEAPCGGMGTCGKCRVILDGKEALACKTIVRRDMTVEIPSAPTPVVLTGGIGTTLGVCGEIGIAVDIGTTTVAAYLMENGQVLASRSRRNPQSAFGADVVSRIRHALQGQGSALTAAIRNCVEAMVRELLAAANKSGFQRICIVGNPTMQQLFLGMPVRNLAEPPFSPLLTETAVMDGGEILPAWKGCELLVVPNISGYIGSDTVGCILAADLDKTEKLTLLVDIGTNGEMVLGNRGRLVACATAAGPALEGAGILFGMQAADGAIDHVDRDFSCHVIGADEAKGICGSGLLDAVSAALHQGLINPRGRILLQSRTLPITEKIHLTQEDIRQLQQAKGAVAAGIRLMAAHLGVSLREIERVYLAGAFGTFLDPHCACRVGLLPPKLEDKIQPIGNAAGSGAKAMVCSRSEFARAQRIIALTEHLDLAAVPGWAKCFAQSMRFDTEEAYWCKKAISLGFSQAVPVNPGSLSPRQDVRDMCAADQCGAYGRNHTCPPHCGTLEECEKRMRGFSRGVLLQTTAVTEKVIDTRAYRRTEAQHLDRFHRFCEALRAEHPAALCLGTGGCRICAKCAWPEPCRFPDKACASMEAYGLFVTEVCRSSGLGYHYGARTITYTACVLF